ncbi:EGF-like domain protein, partial [Ostertagia ostertagi]
CRCDSGFTGEACDVEMDLCSLIPCKNAGLCTSSNGSYTCECKSGWTGKSCDIRDQSVCSDAACKNGGTCESDAGGGIKCLCKPDSSVISVRSVKIHVKRGHVTTGTVRHQIQPGSNANVKKVFLAKLLQLRSALSLYIPLASGRGLCSL